MIANRELASELASTLQSVMLSLDQSAAIVRQRSSEQEATAYATAVATIFMCIYGELLDSIYCDHPDLAPPQWNMDM